MDEMAALPPTAVAARGLAAAARLPLSPVAQDTPALASPSPTTLRPPEPLHHVRWFAIATPSAVRSLTAPLLGTSPPPLDISHSSNAALRRRRAKTDSSVFRYIDPDTTTLPGGFPGADSHPKHFDDSYNPYFGNAYVESRVPKHQAAPAPPPQIVDAVPPSEPTDYLKAITGPIWRIFSSAVGTPEEKEKPQQLQVVPPPAPVHRRKDTRRTHSYAGESKELTPAPPKEAPSVASTLLSYLPKLPALPVPSLPSLPAFLTPTREPPPQLTNEALDTMVRYLYIYTHHSSYLPPNVQDASTAPTKRFQKDAEHLMMSLSPHGARSLHNYLVILKRDPGVEQAFDSGVLSRYARGRREDMDLLVDGLGAVLVKLAEMLDGGFVAPGGWVNET